MFSPTWNNTAFLRIGNFEGLLNCLRHQSSEVKRRYIVLSFINKESNKSEYFWSFCALVLLHTVVRSVFVSTPRCILYSHFFTCTSAQYRAGNVVGTLSASTPIYPHFFTRTFAKSGLFGKICTDFLPLNFGAIVISSVHFFALGPLFVSTLLASTPIYPHLRP